MCAGKLSTFNVTKRTKCTRAVPFTGRGGGGGGGGEDPQVDLLRSPVSHNRRSTWRSGRVGQQQLSGIYV